MTRRRSAPTVADIVADKQVVICAGSGGVGKTTTAAAVAAGIAARGAKVAVLTIDPARRLAGALGLPDAGNEEHRVDAELLSAAGIGGTGELWGMTLDAKKTFDGLIEAHAPDEETRDAVLSNPVYRELSSAVAGSQEYMAMEKLYELHEQGRYDVLVLDTPPAHNALDFLDAPQRLTRFIDSRSLQLFRGAGRASFGILGRGGELMLSALRKATGMDLLTDLAAFFNAFGDMTEGFRKRARGAERLLGAPGTTFLLVTSPRAPAIEEATWFRRRLEERALPFGGVIANRTRVPLAIASPDDLESRLGSALGTPLATKVVRSVTEHQRLADGDAANLDGLREGIGRRPLIVVPELAGDVHDLDGLGQIHRWLFDPPPPASSARRRSGSRRRPQTGAE